MARHPIAALRPGRLRAAVLMLLAPAMLATAAQASVIEISDTGDLTVHDRPEVFLGSGAQAQPIRPASVSEPRTEGSQRALSATASADVRNSLEAEARRNGLSPALVEAVAWRESHFNPSAVSPKGAIGVMQLMPATARGLGVDPHSSAANIRGGTAYLAQLLRRYDGDVIKALAAYNASPTAVDRHGGPPPFKETQAYVAAILDRMASNIANPAHPSPAGASQRTIR